MADLAQCFGVEKAALTGLVDRVERRGLAKRTPVEGDRRALRVTLTDAGRRAATAFHGEVTAELERLLSPLAQHDREHFRRRRPSGIPPDAARSPNAGVERGHGGWDGGRIGICCCRLWNPLAPIWRQPLPMTYVIRREWRGFSMPKVFGLHEIELQPGVEPEEYERFFAEEIARDRYFPRPHEESEEFTRFLEQHPEAAAALEKRYSSPFGRQTDITTDYVAVAE
jgi:hypothetical protein